MGSSTDKKDTGRLHVDFAQARDDLYEWECRQRMLAREERHRRKMEEDRLRPPSPPPIVHYSEHECSQLGDKIKGRLGWWQIMKIGRKKSSEQFFLPHMLTETKVEIMKQSLSIRTFNRHRKKGKEHHGKSYFTPV